MAKQRAQARGGAEGHELVADEPGASTFRPGSEASDQERAQAFAARRAERLGAPTLEHFRRAYAGFGADWPGDDVIRQRHLVAGPGADAAS